MGRRPELRNPSGSGFGVGQAEEGRKKSHRLGGKVITRRIL